MSEFDCLNERIMRCESCPRLRDWCSRVAAEKRKGNRDDDYWGKPVPNFGDPLGFGLIVGLAPAAHGANRTGRMFTGDRSGDWLFRALYEAGLANQPTSESSKDGLELAGVMVTAVCHCAPPDNRPTIEEQLNCRGHLMETIGLRPWRAILCLGGIAWSQAHKAMGAKPVPKFSHGATSSHGALTLLASYHPSQQNTFTGRLTREMLQSVVDVFAAIVNGKLA